MNDNNEVLNDALSFMEVAIAQIKQLRQEAQNVSAETFTLDDIKGIMIDMHHKGFVKGQKELAHALDNARVEAEVDSYIGELSVCGTIDAHFPSSSYIMTEYATPYSDAVTNSERDEDVESCFKEFEYKRNNSTEMT